MNSLIQSVLDRIAAAGKENDSRGVEHARRCLNLEPETGVVLSLLLKLFGAQNVLEIGTSTGYSTICIASCLQARGGRLTTVERDSAKQAEARRNIADAGLSSYVDWKLGEATEIAAALSGPYDCLFFDADRINAPAQLELLLPKLIPPALLLADNALSHPNEIQGYIRRVEEIHNISHAILPVGKGLSVAHVP